MARVELTRHLFTFSPTSDLEGKELAVEASTVAEVVRELDKIAPGNLYVSDDRGDSWQTVANNLPPIYSVRFG